MIKQNNINENNSNNKKYRELRDTAPQKCQLLILVNMFIFCSTYARIIQNVRNILSP